MQGLSCSSMFIQHAIKKKKKNTTDVEGLGGGIGEEERDNIIGEDLFFLSYFLLCMISERM